jgi:hypothetical protein
MDIRILKLVTNEEVLGEVVDTDRNGYWRLKNPVGVAIVAGQDGRPNVGFAPFPIHAEQKTGFEIDIAFSNVVYSYEPAEDFISNYNQIFGAGIVLPSKKLIVG